ncbi:ATPase [Mycobacterium terramassiliense]|uniref:ATPase n=2 Tax=Mycobacterium terramassiliense TaxID=1841859 RepID=A0A2U3N9Y2_9MYCO|nr:ATPase [Mycobacterium terramassiliense]
MATCAGVALAAAVIGARWQLIAFAAPLLGVLCSISWQRPAPKIRVHGEPDSQRCFETERARLKVWVTQENAPSGEAAVALTVSPVAGMELEAVESDTRHAKAVAATAQRWGRYPVRARIEVLARGGLLTGTATVDAADILVFPLTPPQSTPIPQTELLDRLGAHLTRHIGPGVEYADIRPYVPGDQLRAVNWPVSARRRQLHVTQRLTDRAADVVVLIDTYRQPAGPATEATERVVRGAAQVVQTALRHGDRAGIVALGGNRPRWLGADIGQRQFYRVLDTVLAAGDQFENTTGTLAPRAAVPVGAIVIAFSTLLDTEFALALIDLRKRGHVVIAVDILDSSPFEAQQDPLIDRMWALQRSAMYRDMATVGVDIVGWRGDSTLDQSMGVLPDRRHRLRGRLRG